MHQTLSRNADVAAGSSDEAIMEQKRNKILRSYLFRSL